jgi:lantibiotic biosynthesis protein
MIPVKTDSAFLKDIERKIDVLYETARLHQRELTSFGFSRGFLGLSVLTHLYSRHTGNPHYLTEARVLFDEACRMINDGAQTSYPLDMAELGIITQYLCEADVLDLEPNEFLSDVDTILLGKMRAELQKKNAGGFVNGALGYGVYFLQRFPYDRARFAPILRELVEGICQLAIYTKQGCYWISKLNPKEERTYLTMPHGTAAILLFFAKVVEYEIVAAEVLLPVMKESIDYIIHHEVQNQPYRYIDLVQEPHKSRLALCYGDMGVGYALLRAGFAFEQLAWYHKGVNILKHCTRRRDSESSGVKDAGILFGSVGLGIMFSRIHTLTNEACFQEAADFWYASTLDFAEHEDGLAGYKAAYNQWHTHTNLAFSEGIIGIGAGLIKALHSDKVDFDSLVWLF